MRNVSWADVLECNDVNEAVEIFGGILDKTIKNNTKEIVVSRKRFNIQPWSTPGLMRCQRNRDRLHLKTRQNPKNKILQLTYKRYRNFLNDLLRKLKTNYDKQELTINRNNSGKLWQTIKGICHIHKNQENASALCNSNKDPI